MFPGRFKFITKKSGKKNKKIWFLFQEGFISLTVVEPESHLLKAFLLLTVMLYNANLHLERKFCHTSLVKVNITTIVYSSSWKNRGMLFFTNFLMLFLPWNFLKFVTRKFDFFSSVMIFYCSTLIQYVKWYFGQVVFNCYAFANFVPS